MTKRRICIVIFAIMAISVGLIGIRLFAKMILVNKLNMDNAALRVIADYSWGDVMEKQGTPVAENPSERLQGLKNLYECANEVAQRHPQEELQQSFIDKIKSKVSRIEGNIEEYTSSKFMLSLALEKINDTFDKMLGWSNVYAREEGSDFKLKNGSKYTAIEKENMEEKTACIDKMHAIAQKKEAQFLYVQLPYKVDDSKEQIPWGAASFENENADVLLQKLQNKQINTLDLRDALKEKGWNVENGFYISDGHWTIPSAYEATRCIVDKLNAEYDYQYAADFYDMERFKTRIYQTNNAEAPDDVEVVFPSFETNLTYLDGFRNTEFTGAYDESIMDMRMMEDARSTVLTIYMANRIRNSYLCDIINNNKTDNDGKKILILSNSFSWYVASFLALDTSEVIYSYYYDNWEAAELIMDKMQPDTVIMIN